MTMPHQSGAPFVSERVFQNQGVCGQVLPSFPSPTPFLPPFCSRPIFRAALMRKNSFAWPEKFCALRTGTLATQAMLGFMCEHVSKRDNLLNAIRELSQRDLKNCPCFRDVNWQAIEDVQALEQHEVSDEDLLKIVQDMFDETGAADQCIGIHDNEETESD